MGCAAPGSYGLVTVPGCDQQQFTSNISRMMLQQPQQRKWHFESGATTHMSSDASILTRSFPPQSSLPSSIVVGNGDLLPVTSIGSTVLSPSLHLNNVLVSPVLFF
jgi:hypothetical protein